jgi:NitT/TauT family transport system permease protein
LLFNIIAGAAAMPQDLRFTSDLIQLKGWRRWRTLILPSLFPFIITGLITASGGAWNASIVAEYTEFGGQVTSVTGLGSLIAESTARGNYALLLASTLTMIVLVVLINRLVWRRLFRVAETRYRMDQ